MAAWYLGVVSKTLHGEMGPRLVSAWSVIMLTPLLILGGVGFNFLLLDLLTVLVICKIISWSV